MKLSSDALFHFTSRDNLIGILRSNFLPHYNLERFTVPKDIGEEGSPLECAIPIVCFCDVPLSQAKHHVEAYGRNALGLAKEWGKQAGVCPVLYTIPESGITYSTFRIAIRSNWLQQRSPDPEVPLFLKEIEQDLDRLLFHTKPYEGELRRADQEPRWMRFYDEREWRWVPDISEESYPGWTLSEEEYANAREEKAKALWERGVLLPFKAGDVRHIIVEHETDLDTVRRDISEIDRFSEEEKRFLESRLISMERITRDF